MNWLSARVLVGVACVVMGASACSEPPAPKERRSSTTSTLEKPKPSIRTAASKETAKKYGITEWRMFRGKQDLFMTGYDEDGQAVKGISIAFNESDEDGEAQLVTRVHDGSKFTAARSFATQNLTADQLPAGSADFLQQILGDLGGLGDIFQGGGLEAAGIDLPDNAAACGADLTAILDQAIQCTQDAGQAKAAQAACIAAAKVAAQSAADCANVGEVDTTGAELGGIDLSQLGDLGGIDLSQLGGAGGGIDIGQILGQLGGAAGGDGGNPFEGLGGLDLQNPFGGGLGELFGNAQNGDVSFENFGGLFGF
ncbi:MAG: hypothetical protein KIT84_39315 [Labilithrix sp.]|nr:hypothetical protein [Labilithrix sp.]MCW5817112.1 hypothetical protein [Labilithrix sp.]